jgi:serine/threonine-protein kinase HipA
LRVPTTHILKVPRRVKGRESRLEEAAAELAQVCGLTAAQPRATQINGIDVLLIPRFDRVVLDNGRVLRIHQEDFAQALGLPASLKYERYGKDNRRYDAAAIAKLLNQTAEPVVAVGEFLRASIFNLAIGNTDNHAKNHALIYDVGSSPRLAPLYDLLPVRLDSDVRPDLSFNIGAASQLADITMDSIIDFLSSFGFSKPAVRRFISESIAPMLKALDIGAAGLTEKGLKDFDDLIGRELSQLIGVTNINLSIRPRDHFESAGGGWKLGS